MALAAAVRADPDDNDSALNLALLLVAMRRDDEARAAFERLATILADEVPARARPGAGGSDASD